MLAQQATAPAIDEEVKKKTRIELIDNNIIEIEAEVSFSDPKKLDDQINYIRDKILQIFNSHPKTKFSILGVENPKTRNIKISEHYREIGIMIFEHPQTDLLALENTNYFYRSLITVIAAVTGLSNRLRFFPNRESAYNWLMSNKSQ